MSDPKVLVLKDSNLCNIAVFESMRHSIFPKLGLQSDEFYDVISFPGLPWLISNQCDRDFAYIKEVIRFAFGTMMALHPTLEKVVLFKPKSIAPRTLDDFFGKVPLATFSADQIGSPTANQTLQFFCSDARLFQLYLQDIAQNGYLGVGNAHSINLPGSAIFLSKIPAKELLIRFIFNHLKNVQNVVLTNLTVSLHGPDCGFFMLEKGIAKDSLHPSGAYHKQKEYLEYIIAKIFQEMCNGNSPELNQISQEEVQRAQYLEFVQKDIHDQPVEPPEIHDHRFIITDGQARETIDCHYLCDFQQWQITGTAREIVYSSA